MTSSLVSRYERVKGVASGWESLHWQYCIKSNLQLTDLAWCAVHHCSTCPSFTKTCCEWARRSRLLTRGLPVACSPDPSSKYSPYPDIDVQDRQWPGRRITKHPIWLSTYLRDGNQALVNPLSVDQKHRFFRHLLQCNFKEVEVGYPASSETEFTFVRELVQGDEVPNDVWIQVSSYMTLRVAGIHLSYQ